MILTLKSRNGITITALTFVIGQLAILSMAALTSYNSEIALIFTLDGIGLTYSIIMSIVGILTAWQSAKYLESKSAREYKIYYSSLILLCGSLIGVYTSNNIAVTWIFLEATTIATAGLTYHRRTVKALEATWKYIFVSSVGIAIAYLGVLLLSSASPESLNYGALQEAVSTPEASSVYLKLAFLFILVGYSTKMEIFPLFTVGIDANHIAPTAASAFISSSMVSGGFVAIYRVYEVAIASNEASWFSGVLLVVGVLSILSSAIYMGRTSNYKRLLAYSSVENSGLTILGLAMGGVGVNAALIHSLGHAFIKAIMFLQLSVAGQQFKSYKIGQMGNYIKVDRFGSMVLVLALFSLIAAPPSILFKSELMLFVEILNSSKWWLMLIILLPLLMCAYWGLTKVLAILFRPGNPSQKLVEKHNASPFSIVLLIILLALFVLTLWHGDIANNFIDFIKG